jgi:hypothetical protein
VSRRLVRTAIVIALLVAPVVGRASGDNETDLPRLAQRFLALQQPSAGQSPVSYRALRRLDAHNGDRTRSAWMDVWTEASSTSFAYRVVAEEGSGFIRSRVFRASLEKEREAYAAGDLSRAALTPDNYIFAEGAATPDGLFTVEVTPRRKDVLLIAGSIFLRPSDGDLVRVEGRLAKAPSFWVREVDIVRSYRRIAGVRMPVATEATASIRFAGSATFRMTYEYEFVNDARVGAPEPRVARAATE